MSAHKKTGFAVDASKCARCGRCAAVCTSMVIEQNGSEPPRMLPFERYGWRGCWRCGHCLAVCPTGALSIFGKTAADCPASPSPAIVEDAERLVAYRRSCRRYRDDNVDPNIIDRILAAMQNAPAGGNAQTTEYTVIDDKDRMAQIRRVAYDAMEEAAARHRYTSSFDSFYYAKMKRSGLNIRIDSWQYSDAPLMRDVGADPFDETSKAERFGWRCGLVPLMQMEGRSKNRPAKCSQVGFGGFCTPRHQA